MNGAYAYKWHSGVPWKRQLMTNDQLARDVDTSKASARASDGTVWTASAIERSHADRERQTTSS